MDNRNSIFVFIWLCYRQDCFWLGDASVWIVLYSFCITALLPFRVGWNDWPKVVFAFVVAFAIWHCYLLLPSPELDIWLLNSSRLFLHIFLFRQRQILFPCLLCIMALCTHFIQLFAVIFIFTPTTELQMSLTQSFSDCERCERI